MPHWGPPSARHRPLHLRKLTAVDKTHSQQRVDLKSLHRRATAQPGTASLQRPWFRFNGAVELPCSFLEAAFQGSRSRQAYPRAVYEPECWWAPPLQSATGPLAATAAASGRASSAIASTPATAAGRRARLAANSAHSTPPAGWHDAWTLDTLPRRRPSEGSFEAE